MSKHIDIKKANELLRPMAGEIEGNHCCVGVGQYYSTDGATERYVVCSMEADLNKPHTVVELADMVLSTEYGMDAISQSLLLSGALSTEAADLVCVINSETLDEIL